MFLDPELWAQLYRQDRLAEIRREGLYREAEQGEMGQTLWFQVGGWMIRLGRRMQGSSP
ncbi:hypothetical protein HRbin22_02327 [Candidatus Thermoflexus japonica]|uniref:Uncharacterized protein n=1 Tax=Candidatus Thermoflexus japonica TaxID=2035417 RepID=A0A2H5Y9D4_9CHLR|nr:hypothetical protein HRbin22_02327 [Candidatus Thermoflexus japonica]